MSRWMVNVRGQQFSATNMDELRRLAKLGKLGGGDIVQPPGAAEWLYAVEVPELKASLAAAPPVDEWVDASAAPGVSSTTKGVFAGVLIVISGGLYLHAYNLSNSIPDPKEIQLIGSKKGLTYSEVLATQASSLRADASASSAEVGVLQKDKVAELLGKQGSWYKVRVDGRAGYVEVASVIPAYFFADEQTKLDYDPLYNPDRYVYVQNSSWMLLPQSAKRNTTVFQFMFNNDSKFAMTDISVLATIRDEAGQELERRPLKIEGVMPPHRAAMVGTLAPARGDTSEPRVMFSSTFDEILAADPTAAERWTEGVEVKLEAPEWAGADIKLLEVRAVPPTDGATTPG